MQVTEILKQIIHPEEGRDIVTMGMVHDIKEDEQQIRLTIRMNKAHDPAAGSIRRAAESLIREATGITPVIIISEPSPKEKSKKVDLKAKSTVNSIKHIIAIASGKGGVGKSTVTANLAVALTRQGYSVGIIDADIYGPSMPKMFGVEGYQPIAEQDSELIIPAENHGVKVMSIGFFISTSDALVWRGPMATNALKQLMHQTAWGELDFLLIDLPPGTGDLHLTVVGELKIDGAIIVSTPQRVALLDVVRGIKMFRNEHINVPVLGIVSNMAWFTPAELPDNRYYIFGQGALEQTAHEEGIEVLAEIPLVQSIAQGGDNGNPIALSDSITSLAFDALARSVVSAIQK